MKRVKLQENGFDDLDQAISFLKQQKERSDVHVYHALIFTYVDLDPNSENEEATMEFSIAAPTAVIKLKDNPWSEINSTHSEE
jgi:hypothetical protein